jgi:hypothetical protein
MASAIFRPSFAKVADGVAFLTAGFSTRWPQGRSDRTCQKHDPDPFTIRQNCGGLSALQHDFTSCPQRVSASSGRSACPWPGCGIGLAGSSLSVPRHELPCEDIRGAVSACRDPAVCAAHLPSARAGSPPWLGTGRVSSTGTCCTAPATG